MNAELEPLCYRVLSALFNGGYQGLALTVLLWLGLRLLPRTNAATRHTVGFAALLVVAALPVIHFFLPGTRITPAGDPLVGRRASPGRDHVAPSDSPGSAFPGSRGVAESPSRLASSWPISSAPPHHATQSIGLPGSARMTLGDRVAGVTGLVPRSEGLDTSSRGIYRRWQTSLPGWMALGLVGLWVTIGALRCGSLVGECRFLRSLKLQGSAPPERLRKLFDALRREMRVRRRTGLKVVEGPAAPMAVGFLNPAVLLPANLCHGSTGDSLDQILRHELAHLRRGDDWANLAQQALKSALFFHPAVWWLSRGITLDREIACDDHVLAATRTPKAYALFLTEFAGQIQSRNCSAAPAGWSRKSQLKERITMILDPTRNSSPNPARIRAGTLTAAAALLAVLSLHAAPRLELAQSTSEPSGASAGSATVTASATSAHVSSGTESVTAIAKPDHGYSTGRADRNSGPRPKPAPVPRPDPVIPVPPAAPEAAVPPEAPRAPAPAMEPSPRGETIEGRLERLERLIESLLERKDGKSDVDPGQKAKSKAKSSDALSEVHWQLKENIAGELARARAWAELSGPEIAKITKQAQQEAERAMREAGRMQEEAKRAALHARREAGEPRVAHPAHPGHSIEVQRQILESQRRALETQLGHLEQQIARLEAERDHIESRVVEHENLLDDLDVQVEIDLQLEHDLTDDTEAVKSDGPHRESPAAKPPVKRRY